MTTSNPCECHHLEEAHDPIAGCGYCHCTGFRDATSEFSAELRVLGDIALELAVKDLECSGSINPFFLLRMPGGHLEMLTVPAIYSNLYNDRSVRQLIMGAIRYLVDECGLTAVVTAGDAWVGRATRKGMAISLKEFLATATAMNGFKKALDLGLIERAEAAVVTVQTPPRMMTLTQTYVRAGQRIILRELMIAEGDMAAFSGTMKLFGPKEEEESDVETGDPRRSV